VDLFGPRGFIMPSMNAFASGAESIFPQNSPLPSFAPMAPNRE
jgi:hypothetical protein